MIIITGTLLKEREYTSKKSDFKVREILIEEDNGFMPRSVQLPADFVLKAKVGDKVQLPIRFSAWDEKTKKFTPNGVKINVVNVEGSAEAKQ